MSNILVELSDLIRAEQEMNKLIQKLQQSQQLVKNIMGGIEDWKGQSSQELQAKLNAFTTTLNKQIHNFEGHKVDLVKYTYRMEQVDRQ